MASSCIQSSSAFDATIKESEASLFNAKIFKPLDEMLRCRICFDYFTNCMITKCSHNYCSVCIRRYMNYKTQCPTCFQDAIEPELRNNRLIDEILRIYKKIRETIQIPVDSKFSSDPSTSLRAIDGDNCEKSTSLNTHTQISSKENKAEEANTSDEVSCPVCYILVPNSRINIHLDSCLKQTEERNQRKFLPKLVYHLLSDKDIRKKLKDLGLSTSGNKQALIRRHKNFTILFNANCDALEPKPVSELICEIERQELEERINVSQKNQTQVNKKSDPSVIEKEHENYVREHKSQFNALIEDVQLRSLGQNPIKTEVDLIETIAVSNITDKSGNVIGESTLRVGNSSDFDSVNVKEEFSESLLKDADIGNNLDLVDNVKTRKSALVDKKSDPDLEKTSQLPFRIKKELPSVKMKEGSLDMTTKLEFTTDSSSLEDFETRKMQVSTYHKKKNARRLSTEEKGSQRKK